jgi:hypothetical protein
VHGTAVGGVPAGAADHALLFEAIQETGDSGGGEVQRPAEVSWSRGDVVGRCGLERPDAGVPVAGEGEVAAASVLRVGVTLDQPVLLEVAQRPGDRAGGRVAAARRVRQSE